MNQCLNRRLNIGAHLYFCRMNVGPAMLMICLCLLGSSLRAQTDSTVVRLLIKGGERYSVLIDGELQPATNFITVSRGGHDITIWSFKHEVYKGQLETGQLDSTSFYAELKRDDAYIAYIFEKDRYKRQLFFQRTGPFLLGASGLVTLPFTQLMRTNSHEQLVKDEFYHRFSQVNQSTLDNSQRRYQINNAMFFASAGAAIIGTGAFLLLRKRVKALKAPEYRQQNPFTMEWFELGYHPSIQSPVMGLSMRF